MKQEKMNEDKPIVRNQRCPNCKSFFKESDRKFIKYTQTTVKGDIKIHYEEVYEERCMACGGMIYGYSRPANKTRELMLKFGDNK